MKITERVVQIAMHLQALQSNYTVQHELSLNSGRVDLLCHKDTSTQLIEVKSLSNCKHALGQLIAYKADLDLKYPNVIPVALLYSSTPDTYHKKASTTLTDTFNNVDIRLVYANELWEYSELAALQHYINTKETTPCLNPNLLKILALY